MENPTPFISSNYIFLLKFPSLTFLDISTIFFKASEKVYLLFIPYRDLPQRFAFIVNNSNSNIKMLLTVKLRTLLRNCICSLRISSQRRSKKDGSIPSLTWLHGMRVKPNNLSHLYSSNSHPVEPGLERSDCSGSCWILQPPFHHSVHLSPTSSRISLSNHSHFSGSLKPHFIPTSFFFPKFPIFNPSLPELAGEIAKLGYVGEHIARSQGLSFLLVNSPTCETILQWFFHISVPPPWSHSLRHSQSVLLP